MRVFISGGGIAGLTLAYWLHRYNISSVVIEQSQDLRRDGNTIDFLGTGYAVAERMDLIDRLRAQQIPFQALIYVNKTGMQIAKLDATLLRAITDGKYMGLMHSTLEAACTKQSPIRLRCGSVGRSRTLCLVRMRWK